MNRIFRFLLAPGALFALSMVSAEEPTPSKKEDARHGSVWMRKKLDYTQSILAGLTAGDFDQIADSARAMKALGKVEAFARSRNPAYKHQLDVFEGINDELIRQANEDNTDGVALALTQLTINCVQCHKAIRRSDPTGAAK